MRLKRKFEARSHVALDIKIWKSKSRLRRRLFDQKLERAMGIEPTSVAWEATVMAIIRRPRQPSILAAFHLS
jgi:hypothetical protein